MNCREAEQHLWEYYDEACPLIQRQGVEAHLIQCRECRSSLDEWIALSQKAFHAQDVKAPAYLWTRVLAGIEEQEQTQGGAWWVQWRWMSHVAAAATLLVTLAAGMVFYQNAQASNLENLLHGVTSAKQARQLLSQKPPNTEEVTAWLTEGEESSWLEN